MSSDEEYSSKRHSFINSSDKKVMKEEPIDELEDDDLDSFEGKMEQEPSSSKSKPKKKSYPRKQGECVQCKKFAKRITKQMCSACYTRSLEPNNCCLKCMAVARVGKDGLCPKCSDKERGKLRRANLDNHKECKGCKEVKYIAANGLCKKCYYRSLPKTKQTCQECKQVKILHDKNSCHKCYRLKLDKTNKRLCRACGIIKPHVADDMCQKCYDKSKKENVIKHKQCVACKQTKQIHGNGMCKKCYNKSLKADVKKHKQCKKCKKTKFIFGHGMCQACYSRSKRQANEVDKSKHKKCFECKQTKLIHARETCKACYYKIFITPKQTAKRRLSKKKKQIKVKQEPIDETESNGSVNPITVKEEIKMEPEE